MKKNKFFLGIVLLLTFSITCLADNRQPQSIPVANEPASAKEFQNHC